jgi:ligand-binding sensor domain-containing protein
LDQDADWCLDPATGVVKRYMRDPNDAGSLSHDGVYALLFDRSGRLWVGTDGGLTG